MLLIISDKYDAHADFVQEKLFKHNVENFRINLDVDALKKTKITRKNSSWVIVNEYGNSVFSDEINLIWCRRPFVHLTLQEKQSSDTALKIWKNEWNRTLLGLYADLEQKNWLSPLRNSLRGENKYLQLNLAVQAGFSIPLSITSNVKTELLEFAEKFENVVFKVMEQEIYNDNENNPVGIYANKISVVDLLDFNVEDENPIFLQEYIKKSYEVRYTVVNGQHFVCKIDSQKSKISKDDWRRYDLANTPYFIITPPEEIKQKVDFFMQSLGINYGALDFIVTPTGDWVFLEINCMGQWLWIEQLTGLSISDSIVNWAKINSQVN